MTFQLLAPDLHATALSARKYFQAKHGAKGFRYEEVISRDLPLKLTLSAKLSDGYMLGVEVSERAYSNSLDTFVVECNAHSFPLKLYVVIPSMKGDPDFTTNLRKAKDRGIGIIELI